MLSRLQNENQGNQESALSGKITVFVPSSDKNSRTFRSGSQSKITDIAISDKL